MLKTLRTSLLMLLLMTLLTGLIYPLVVTGLAQVIFPAKANGSILYKDDKPVGSALIGQAFDDPRYFWGRPSATSPAPYNAASSSGSNLGPTNQALIDAVKSRVETLQKLDPDNKQPVPVDLVTASASGLDPDISPAAAAYQVPRIAKLRGLDPKAVQSFVDDHIQKRQLGFLGEPRVNVLELNLALDRMGKGANP